MARHLTVESEDDFCTLALKDILFGHFNPETAESVEISEMVSAIFAPDTN